MTDRYYEAMRQKGFSNNTMDSIRKVKCPNCGFEFSLTYARTFACRGCAEAVRNCPKVRCAKCDTEFYMKDMAHIANQYKERAVATHMNKIVTDYYDDNGWKKSR
jgi:hypothetical protein